MLFLEAVQTTLLLFLVGIELRHALLKCGSCSFSSHAHLTFLFDSLQTGAGVATLFSQANKLVLETLTLLTPVLHLGLRSVGRGLEIDKCFFERRCELLLGEQVLLDRPNSSFLVLDKL